MPKIVDHEQQRYELSATVAEVVAEQGLENTTLRNVAAAHGCTKGMVQHYFADKEQLLLGALEFVEEMYEARMEAATEGLDGLDFLAASLQAQLPLKPEIEQEWRVRLAFNTRAAISPDMREVLSGRYSAQLKTGLACLKQAEKARKLQKGVNLRNAYRSLLALVYGLGVGAVMDPKLFPAAAQRQILATAIDGLRR